MTRGEAVCSSKHGFYSSSGFADSLLSNRRAYVLFNVLGVDFLRGKHMKVGNGTPDAWTSAATAFCRGRSLLLFC